MITFNIFKEKTALAIITCNREEFLHKALESVNRDAVGEIFVINAGKPLENKPDGVKVIQCNRNPTPVGIAKNIALREMKKKHDFLFLMEDDVIVKDNKVFEKYILTAMDSGLWAGQLSYGVHGGVGGGNVSDDGTPLKKLSVKYSHTTVDMYKHSLHAFVLYHSGTLKHIGYMGENYLNAAEHLDHYYVAFLKGLGNSYWYFPDIENSFEYLEDIDTNHNSSVIRNSPDFRNYFSTGWGIFKEKYDVYPHEITDSSVEEVMKRLDFIEAHYSQKQIVEDYYKEVDLSTKLWNVSG
jgi:hypothetical protein